MDPLTLLLRLPLLPVQGVISLGGVIRDQAEQELHDPAAVRRQLEAAEQAQASGALSREEIARIEEEALGRLIRPEGGPARDDRG
jgi:hypothetical protein